MKVTIRKLVEYKLNGKSVSKDTAGAVKTESSNWYLFGRDLTGKQVRKATGTDNFGEAQRQATRLEVGLEDGKATADNLKSLRYEDLREDYLLEDPKRTSSHHLKRLDVFFKNVKVPALESRIAQFIKSRRAEGISDSAIKRGLKPLVAMLNLAAEHNRIPRVPWIPKLKDGKVRSGFIEADVFNRLRDVMPAHLQALLTFVYYTGTRIGAARQITWGMVNRASCTSVTIPGHIQKNGEAMPPLPLIGPLEEVSKALRAMLKEKNADGSLRMRLDSDLVFSAKNLRKEWNKAVASLGLGTYDKKKGTRTGLTIHDFRRSAARNLRRSGVDEATAMLVTGHKTSSMFKRYAITGEDDVRDALLKVGQFTQQPAAQ